MAYSKDFQFAVTAGIRPCLAVDKAELAMVKWMMGVVLAGIVALVLKAF